MYTKIPTARQSDVKGLSVSDYTSSVQSSQNNKQAFSLLYYIMIHHKFLYTNLFTGGVNPV